MLYLGVLRDSVCRRMTMTVEAESCHGNHLFHVFATWALGWLCRACQALGISLLFVMGLMS